ncbi:MAG: acetylglutamate kinase [Pelagibacteraceae bacterium]|jgi:acetylglutamate kinase|nr:acetylglutamate kinase [Pelagibacteraceae bacterium]
MSAKEDYLQNLKSFWPKNAPDISQIPKYVSKYKKEEIVIKCGGKVLIDPDLFDKFIEDVSVLHKLGLKIIIIHGGGPRIKIELAKLNIESQFINGLRVTDNQTMKVVEKTLIDFNSEIVEKLKKKNCKSEGVNVNMNNVLIVEQENKELGFVGKPTKVIKEKIQAVMNKNLIPVLSPMGKDEKEQKYNINADTAAAAVAKSLKARRLLLMTDVEGVYDENKKLISEIKPDEAKNLITKKIVQGGMIPKLLNSIDAIENGVRGVVIIDGRKLHSVLFEIFSDEGAGTLIRK